MDEIRCIPSERLVYIDETGIDSYIYRTHAWSRKGKCIYEKICGRKYKRVGIVAGLCYGEIIEPMQYDGTINSEVFEEWFSKFLCPSVERGKVSLMDNAAFHRKKNLESIVESFGHRIIFHLPYSPEFNPIEYLWAALKKRLQKVIDRVRSFDEALALYL